MKKAKWGRTGIKWGRPRMKWGAVVEDNPQHGMIEDTFVEQGRLLGRDDGNTHVLAAEVPQATLLGAKDA